MPRVLGIDLGTRRIGVAVTDGLGLTAQPLETIERHGGKRDLEAIAKLVRAHDVETVVVGLAENHLGGAGADGGDSRMARLAREFAERLRAELGLAVELFDESFTTVEAERVLLDADLSRARRREVVDRVAAAIILQRWLAVRGGPTS